MFCNVRKKKIIAIYCKFKMNTYIINNETDLFSLVLISVYLKRKFDENRVKNVFKVKMLSLSYILLLLFFCFS